MKKYLRLLSILFLAVLTGTHTISMTWSFSISLFFSFGLLLAIAAHTKKNYVTIVILVVHMAIEWFEWAKEKITTLMIIYNLFHATVDFIFLSEDLEIHIQQHKKTIIVGVFGILSTIFLIGRVTVLDIKNIQQLEPIVLGGVWGCIFSHLYFHFKRAA